MSYNRRTQAALVDHLECADRAIEVGIGRRPAVAAELTDRGTAVTATDIHERSVPEEIRFVCDDITDPDLDLYDGADVIYALNLPPELHGALVSVADAVGASCRFTTLGGDPPAVPVEPITLSGETLYRPLGED